MTGRKNLFCFDASPQSSHAFMWYLENHHKPDDTVIFVHVHQTPPYPVAGLWDGGMAMCSDEYNLLIQSSLQVVKNLKHKYEKLCDEKNVKTEFVIADDYHTTGQVICQVAKDRGVEAIFLGQRGLGMVSRALLGSTSDYVVHHSTVPIIVVPTK